jgi:hypothetical protein
MKNSDVVSALTQKLRDTGLADMSGALLYSSIATLAPGKLYVLGYNPGGDPLAETDNTAIQLAKHAKKRPDWNEYIDGDWKPGGRLCAVGGAPMQKRVRHLITALGSSVQEVCASNLIFVRSRVPGHLTNQARLAQSCCPVHQFILNHVRPAAILSIGGGPVFEFICQQGRLISGPERFKAGHGNWGCLAGRVELGDQEIALVSVPHLARYAIISIRMWFTGRAANWAFR